MKEECKPNARLEWLNETVVYKPRVPSKDELIDILLTAIDHFKAHHAGKFEEGRVTEFIVHPKRKGDGDCTYAHMRTRDGHDLIEMIGPNGITELDGEAIRDILRNYRGVLTIRINHFNKYFPRI